MRIVKTKKILLYGQTGFIGSSLINDLKEKFDISAPTHSEVDLTNFNQLSKNIAETDADLIIYAAGLANVDKCEEQLHLANLLNAKVPGVIAKEAANLNIPLYYFSTDAVFDGNKSDSPYTEEDKVNPFSVYGQTKAMGEEVVLSSSNLNVVIRIIMPFSHYYPKKTDFIRMAIGKLSKGEIFTGIIDQVINPIYTDYLTKALECLIQNNSEGIYHLGATDSDTNFNILKRLAELLNLDTNLLIPITLENFLKDKKVQRAKYCWLDVSKFQQECNKDTLNTLEVSLKQFTEKYQMVK